MPVLKFNEMTWTEIQQQELSRAVAILPVGATEAHGPHLTLNTDVIIADAMAQAGARKLLGRGITVFILPPLHYTSASFASNFPGTISLSPKTVTNTILDIAASLKKHGITTLAIANSHLDPTHLSSLYDVANQLNKENEGFSTFSTAFHHTELGT